jgi:hypothetical protein
MATRDVTLREMLRFHGLRQGRSIQPSWIRIYQGKRNIWMGHVGLARAWVLAGFHASRRELAERTK